MNRHISLAMTLLAGIAIGAVAVGGLHAQNKAPGAYAVIDISEISDPTLFKSLLPKVAASNAAFGGQNVIVTENIVALDGTPPKRYILVSFDSIDKAKAWDSSAGQKEITAIRQKSAKSRAFIVDGTIR